MGMGVNEQSSVADEYKKYYPKEKARIQTIKLEESIYRQTIFLQKQDGPHIDPSEFNQPEYHLKRWGPTFLNDREHLIQFLKVPRPFGSIYVRRHYPLYAAQQLHQTMRNTSIANQVYEFGHTYVGIGFVDLFQIAWGTYKDSLSHKNLTFYGYDSSRVTTLRSKIIYSAMQLYEEDEISTESLLQIWFSSCWDLKTSNAFDRILKDALADPKKFQLDSEDVSIVEKWQKVTISKKKAGYEFSKGLRNSSFDEVWRVKSKEDQIKFCRYLFNGCIFVDEKNIVCGNKTMFADVCGTTKMEEEFFFKAIDLTASGFERDRHSDSLFDTVVGVTSKTILGFRSFVKIQKIQCHLMTKLIDPHDLQFAATIKSLHPYSIDWSNVPDYFEKNSFIKFARACSVDDTVHTLHFLNWPQYVLGACHIDWVNCQHKCREFYREMKIADEQKHRLLHKALQDKKSMFSFFKSVPYINNLNEINMFLAIQFRSHFEDFFLSDEEGNILTRFKSTSCDSAVCSFFDQSHTMIRSAFTFNDDMKLSNEYF